MGVAFVIRLLPLRFSLTRRRRAPPRCELGPELPATAADSLDDVVDGARDRLRDETRKLKDELHAVAENTVQKAQDIVEERKLEFLQPLEEQRDELLRGVERDRELIRDELSYLTSLARNGKEDSSPVTTPGDKRQSLLRVVTIAFAAAAVYYAVSALVNSDSSALTNAVVDVFAAATAAYFLLSQKRP